MIQSISSKYIANPAVVIAPESCAPNLDRNHIPRIFCHFPVQRLQKRILWVLLPNSPFSTPLHNCHSSPASTKSTKEECH